MKKYVNETRRPKHSAKIGKPRKARQAKPEPEPRGKRRWVNGQLILIPESQ